MWVDVYQSKTASDFRLLLLAGTSAARLDEDFLTQSGF